MRELLKVLLFSGRTLGRHLVFGDILTTCLCLKNHLFLSDSIEADFLS